MKSNSSKLILSFVVILIAISAVTIHNNYFLNSTAAHLVLLLPDNTKTDSPKVTVWLDAIKEEGFLVTVMHDSDFLRPWTNRELFSGVILPDQVHKAASDTLISTLSNYVANGGNLMLVYDAGVWSLEERYITSHSRFSELAGVNYAYYNKLQEKTINWYPVLGSANTFAKLRVPPGKFDSYNELSYMTHKEYPTLDESIVKAGRTFSVSGYQHALVNYDIYDTGDDYRGEVLLQSPAGDIIAGQRKYGKGQVLFINLPLGYLKGRTDGLFLHSFIHYFANKIVKLPYLAAVPGGVGGLVMNWHLDSNVTFKPLKKIRELGVYQQGPYSIHITAGPDSTFIGDKKGVNVPKNKVIQNWIRFFTKRDYQVGSHGGWIHDHFGNHVSTKKSKEFEAYLVKNKQAIEEVSGIPVTEYSAPKGNHPEWVTEWLSNNKINSYYFTGNTGMAPTRSYRNGILKYTNVWSFPILPYRDMAGFEELVDLKVKPAIVKNWLIKASVFAADSNSIRLIYFHPRGALHYKNAMRSWLAKAKKLQEKKRFRWYTMTNTAKFLTRRNEVTWYFKPVNNSELFSANHPYSLNNLSWFFSEDIYNMPEITEGKATITNINSNWVVIAGNSKQLNFKATKKKND